MNPPSLTDLDQIRQMSFRPSVVGCFINQSKVMFVYHEKYDLWQFPQGGIKNKEPIDEALINEMREELGDEFISHIDRFTLIGEDRVEFLPAKYTTHNLKTDAGEHVVMKGKHYFFYAIFTRNRMLRLADTEFSDFEWVYFNEGMKLAQTIYQTGKQRITKHALELLKESEYIE